MVISTAGYDKSHFAWAVREMAIAEEDWYFSSRGQCASWISPKWLAQQKRSLPPHVFSRLHENLWIDGVGAYLTEAEVHSIFTAEALPETVKHFAGLDLGIVKDRSVLAVAGSATEGRVVVKALRTWVPPKGGKVDLQDVEDTVAAVTGEHLVAATIYDPHQAQHMAQRLRVRGLTMVEYAFTSASRHDLFSKLLDLIRRGRLVAEPHPELKKELLRLEVKETQSG
jgi:phage terminase large subunit-like protein